MMGIANKKWFPSLFFVAPLLLLLWRSPCLGFYLNSADHGYQLSLGRQVLMGKFPFVDLFFHYGPLTAFSSAFGLWISNSLIPETVICAIGYAIAFFLIHYLVKSYGLALAGWLTPIIGFLFLARFYKWYYWLFPLLVLYCYHVVLSSEYPHNQKWFYLAGIFGGIGGLYRLDLGIATVCCYGTILLGMNLKPLNLKAFGWQFTKFLIGFCLPCLIWVLILWEHGGTVQDYLGAILVGGKGVVEKWSLPLPTFDINHPLSRQSGSAIIFMLIPLTHIVCLFFGGWNWFYGSTQCKEKYKFMAAVGLFGLGLFPQALYRSDIAHLLQVFPSVLIAGGLLVSELWKGTILPKNNIWGRFLSKSFAGLYLIIASVSGWGIRDYGGSDLTKFAWNPVPRYQQLSQGIHSSLNHPIIRLVAEIQKQTTEKDRILVIPLACQLYYFANRPMSGFLNGFARGILDNDKWRQRNLEAIQQNPPTVIIAKDGFFSLSPDDMFRASQPELFVFLSTHYTRIIYQQDGWLLLKQP